MLSKRNEHGVASGVIHMKYTGGTGIVMFFDFSNAQTFGLDMALALLLTAGGAAIMTANTAQAVTLTSLGLRQIP